MIIIVSFVGKTEVTGRIIIIIGYGPFRRRLLLLTVMPRRPWRGKTMIILSRRFTAIRAPACQPEFKRRPSLIRFITCNRLNDNRSCVYCYWLAVWKFVFLYILLEITPMENINVGFKIIYIILHIWVKIIGEKKH